MQPYSRKNSSFQTGSGASRTLVRETFTSPTATIQNGWGTNFCGIRCASKIVTCKLLNSFKSLEMAFFKDC